MLPPSSAGAALNAYSATACSANTRTLLENGLLDELHVWIFPVLVGGGQRLIDGIDVTHLELVGTTPFESGIVVNAYAPKN